MKGPRKRAAPQRYVYSDDDEEPVIRKKKSRSDPKPGQKRRRCGECAGCNAENCGECVYCKDMPQFGGDGNMRQSCKERACEVLMREVADAKAKEQAERAVVREAEREQRDAEREEQRTSREADRLLQRNGRTAERNELRDAKKLDGAHRAAQMAIQLSGRDRMAGGARVPTIALDPDLSGGWGVHAIPQGTEVEVHLMEEGLEGSMLSLPAAATPHLSLPSSLPYIPVLCQPPLRTPPSGGPLRWETLAMPLGAYLPTSHIYGAVPAGAFYKAVLLPPLVPAPASPQSSRTHAANAIDDTAVALVDEAPVQASCSHVVCQ